MSKRLRIAGVAVWAICAAPLAAQAESLADALVAAYNHSGLLDQNRALLRAADEDVALQVSALRPILNWSAGVTASESQFASAQTAFSSTDSNSLNATIGLNMELLLWDSGATQLAIEASKEAVLATRQALISAEQQVLLRAVAAYMNVRRQSEIVALRQSNLRLITEELRAARDRFEVGEVTRTDVALAEARLAGARSDLAAAQGDLFRSGEEYLAAVGRRPGALAQPARLPRTADSVEGAKAVAEQGHPELRRAQHEVSVADLNVMRAEAGMNPRMTLNGQVGLSDDLDSKAYTRNLSLGVNIGGPIYQGGRLSALVRQAMAQRDASRANLHTVRYAVAQNAGDAWAQLRVAEARIEATDRQITAARVAFQGVREEATLGARTTLDVLNAEQELLDAEAGRISAVADEYIAAYSLLSSMGLMTADHLGLAVQQYDPTAYFNLVKTAPTKNSQQGKDLDRVLRALGKQ